MNLTPEQLKVLTEMEDIIYDGWFDGCGCCATRAINETHQAQEFRKLVEKLQEE